MLTCFHRQQQQQIRDNNTGQRDPYVSFLLRQATQKPFSNNNKITFLLISPLFQYTMDTAAFIIILSHFTEQKCLLDKLPYQIKRFQKLDAHTVKKTQKSKTNLKGSKFCQMKPWPKCYAFPWSVIMQASSWVNQRSICLEMLYGYHRGFNLVALSALLGFAWHLAKFL